MSEPEIYEEKEGSTRTYLVRDSKSNEIVAYFSLKTGLITVKKKFRYFNNLTGIELANFAVNGNYRKKDDIPHMGAFILNQFVIPTALKAREYVGVTLLYIFAINEKCLINHYASMGFSRVGRKMERFIHRHVKPKYDEGCIFMYHFLTEEL